MINESASFESSDNTLQNSTHIYMNMLEETLSAAGHHSTQSVVFPRPQCDGSEDSVVAGEAGCEEVLYCQLRASEEKVSPWLQSCAFSVDSDEVDDVQDSSSKDLSVDSDASAFLEVPLARPPVKKGFKRSELDRN